MSNPPVRDTHTCPCGCGAQVPRHQLACKPGWFRLPPDLRGWIAVAYRQRRTDPFGHTQALQAAVQWYHDHPRPS